MKGVWRFVTLPRVRALDHAKGVWRFVTLPRVRALDHANPCEGLHSAYGDVSLYLAFVRSTTRIPVKGCIPDRWGRCHPGYKRKINITEIEFEYSRVYSRDIESLESIESIESIES